MNNETTAVDDDRQEAGPLAGQRLAKARKARDISIFDIAKELHLDEYKVQALEENKFDVLGAPVFAKGHLRKYAELVGVPIDDILADYYSLNRAVGAPPVVGRPRKQARELNLGPWIVGVLIIAVIGGAVYWWLGRPPAPAASSAPVTATETRLELPAQPEVVTGNSEADTAGESAPLNAPAAADETAPAPTPVSDESAAPAAAVIVPPTASPASDSQVRLTMTFEGDCWTEVSDASGARLYFDLGRAGRTINVSGEPPLRVLFGNSDNVNVAVDGRDYPILAAMRRGQTARLTINKP